MYKFVATGFPVCPTCSLCGLQPISDTGFEQAVAAPSVPAKSSIKFQFSGPFIPLPAETTISASAIEICPDTFSDELTVKPDTWISIFKSSISVSTEFSIKPNELLDNPMTIFSELIDESLKALLVKAVLLIVKGAKLLGRPITLLTYVALILAANNGAKYFESKLLLNTI